MLEESVSTRDLRFADEHNCVAIPFWVLILNRISQLLLTVNASVGSVIYCIMSRDFRYSDWRLINLKCQSLIAAVLKVLSRLKVSFFRK